MGRESSFNIFVVVLALLKSNDINDINDFFLGTVVKEWLNSKRYEIIGS